MLEIETKLGVPDLAPVRARLKALDARFVGRYVETNHILDRTDGSLRNAGCGLRVRLMETIEGYRAPSTLTFKGPAQASDMKRREELETAVQDAASLLAILHAVGLDTVMEYRKRRERWTLGNCRVELDEVPLLGTFVEIEGASEDAVRTVQKRLGLADAEHVRPGYVRMLARRCRESGRSAIGIDFDKT